MCFCRAGNNKNRKGVSVHWIITEFQLVLHALNSTTGLNSACLPVWMWWACLWWCTRRIYTWTSHSHSHSFAAESPAKPNPGSDIETGRPLQDKPSLFHEERCVCVCVWVCVLYFKSEVSAALQVPYSFLPSSFVLALKQQVFNGLPSKWQPLLGIGVCGWVSLGVTRHAFTADSAIPLPVKSVVSFPPWVWGKSATVYAHPWNWSIDHLLRWVAVTNLMAWPLRIWRSGWTASQSPLPQGLVAGGGVGRKRELVGLHTDFKDTGGWVFDEFTLWQTLLHVDSGH